MVGKNNFIGGGEKRVVVVIIVELRMDGVEIFGREKKYYTKLLKEQFLRNPENLVLENFNFTGKLNRCVCLIELNRDGEVYSLLNDIIFTMSVTESQTSFEYRLLNVEIEVFFLYSFLAIREIHFDKDIYVNLFNEFKKRVFVSVKESTKAALSFCVAVLTCGEIISRKSLKSLMEIVDSTKRKDVYPFNLFFRYIRASILKEQYKFTDAANELGKAMEITCFAKLYNMRSECFYHLGQFENSIEDLSVLIKQFCEDKAMVVTFSVNRALIHWKLKQYEDAEFGFEEGLRISKEHGFGCLTTLEHRGDMFYEKGSFQKALNDYTEIMEDEFETSNPRVSIKRIRCLTRLKKYSRCHERIEELLRVNPTFSKAFYEKANCFRMENKFGESKRCYEKAISLNPKNPNYFNQFGELYRIFGSFDKALECYDKAIQIQPHFSFHYNKSRVLTIQGLCQLSLREIEKGIVLKSDSIELLLEKAGTYMSMSMSKKAEVVFQDVFVKLSLRFKDNLQKFPKKYCKFFLRRGENFLDLGSIKEGTKFLNLALNIYDSLIEELPYESFYPYMNAVWCQMMLGNYKLALGYGLRVTNNGSEKCSEDFRSYVQSKHFWFSMALVYLELDDRKNCSECFQKSIDCSLKERGGTKKFVAGHAGMAYCFVCDNDLANCEKHLKKAEEFSKNLSACPYFLHYAKGFYYKKKQQWTEAKEEFMNCISRKGLMRLKLKSEIDFCNSKLVRSIAVVLETVKK